MNRDNHYEAAFEAYLRAQGAAVVAIDETRRSYLDDESIKSPDFLVVGQHETRLVVDVKGRRFPGGRADHPRKVWQNWCEQADVDALEKWSQRLGSGFQSVLAFVYHILPCVELTAGTVDCFTFRDKLYLMRGVAVEDYRMGMRVRSPRWNTVHLPTAAFRAAVKPFSHFLKPVEVPEEPRQWIANNPRFIER